MFLMGVDLYFIPVFSNVTKPSKGMIERTLTELCLQKLNRFSKTKRTPLKNQVFIQFVWTRSYFYSIVFKQIISSSMHLMLWVVFF